MATKKRTRMMKLDKKPVLKEEYVVSGKLEVKTEPVGKAAANKVARKIRSMGGTAIIRKK